MLSLLKLAAHTFSDYQKIAGKVNKKNIGKIDRVILNHLEDFHELTKTESVDLDVFRDYLLGKIKDRDTESYIRIIDNMKTPLNDNVKSCIVDQLVQTNLAAAVTETLLAYEEGDEIDLLAQLEAAVEDAKESRIDLETEFATELELEQTFTQKKGFKWFLNVLNDHMKPLVGGDDLIVAARPNKGKTTFMCCQLISMAQETENDILWFNNEGPKVRIFRRLIQSALRITESEMLKMQKEGTLIPAYVKVVGRVDKIKVFDVHGKSTSDLLAICARSKKIDVFVFDMMDNVRLARARSSDRTDEVLEKLYIWARDQATIFDAVSFKTSQISDGGKDTPYPSDAFLKDSRTGKQGATDTIITIGHCTEAGLEMTRYLGAPKNKLKREGASPLKAEVVLIEDRSYFSE